MLLDGHKASFDNFSILLKEGNPFKLVEGIFVILLDKPIFNKNNYSTPFLWNCLTDYDIVT